ncbi:hypothetical protein Zm00014a_025247, partial [Zea mays]
RYCSRAIVTA